MDLNGIINSKLQTQKSYPVHRIVGILVAGVGISQNKHDFGLRVAQFIWAYLFLIPFKDPFIYFTLLSFRSGYGYLLAVLYRFCSVFCSYYSDCFQLSGNNGSVAGPSTAVSDNGRCLFDNWIPIGISDFCNQHLPLL